MTSITSFPDLLPKARDLFRAGYMTKKSYTRLLDDASRTANFFATDEFPHWRDYVIWTVETVKDYREELKSKVTA